MMMVRTMTALSDDGDDDDVNQQLCVCKNVNRRWRTELFAKLLCILLVGAVRWILRKANVNHPRPRCVRRLRQRGKITYTLNAGVLSRKFIIINFPLSDYDSRKLVRLFIHSPRKIYRTQIG